MNQPEETTEITQAVAPRDQVIAWLLEGQRDGDISEAMKARWPGEDHRALLLSAVDHFEAAANCNLQVVIGWGMEAYKDLYRRMVAAGDFADAMKAVKELVTMAGKHCVRDEEDETEEADESKAAAKTKRAAKGHLPKATKKAVRKGRGNPALLESGTAKKT